MEAASVSVGWLINEPADWHKRSGAIGEAIASTMYYGRSFLRM